MIISSLCVSPDVGVVGLSARRGEGQDWPEDHSSNLDKYILQSRQIHFTIKTNTFYNLDKYVLQSRQIYLTFGQINLVLGLSALGEGQDWPRDHSSSLDKYILQLDTNTLQLNKLILQSRWLHFAIKTSIFWNCSNTFCNLVPGQ